MLDNMPTIPFQLRLPPELHRRAKHAAIDESLTLGDFIRAAILARLDCSFPKRAGGSK